MNQKLKNIIETIQQSEKLDAEQKKNLITAVKEADREFEITAFKLERTEKVKKTTAILLEETIEELEQKRKAVEAQNRELEIEASLERVRAIAMGMKQPEDMIDVCRIISDQLEILGVSDIRNIQTAIINKKKGTYLNYEYFTQYKTTSILEIVTKLHPVVEEFAKEILKSKDTFFTKTFEGEALKDWIEYRKNTSQNPDPILESTKSVHYYFYSIGPGALGISTYSPLTDEEIKVFKRFRNVFELAYRRFIDIEKAIAQAREAQIEASLERVRAKAMAMHKSDDLNLAILTVFEELEKLDINILRYGIGIIDKESRTGDIWTSVKKGKKSVVQVSSKEKFDQHPLSKGIFEAWLKQKDFSYVLRGKDLDVYYKAVAKTNLNLPKSRSLVQATKERKQYFYTTTFQRGNLYAFSEQLLTEDDKKVLKRFASVLNLTYNRFLDLQKAEAQAREAQIELALERIRARTMAMQHSDELAETAQVLFQQFSELGENPDQLSIGIMNEPEKVLEIWLSVQGTRMNRMFKAPIREPIVINKIYAAWKKQKKSLVLDMSGSQLKKYSDFRNSLPEFKEYKVVKNRKSKEENRRVIYCAFFPKGLLSIATPEPRPAETVKLLERFAAVFDLTYTRFLDLQKAEAQAREAQIEAALERVRSRTMAMHQSNELADTAAVLFRQLIDLGIAPNRLYIGIMKNKSGDVEFWITDEDGSKVSSGFSANLKKNHSFKKMLRGWIENKKSITIDMKGKELQDYFQHLQKLHVPFKGGLSQKRRVQNIAFFSQGLIGLASPDLQPEETINLLERFAAVFNLTYRRFLDLQKAEAQAREAQIEASLERVRAKAMAMHSSKDLAETIVVFYSELKSLGVIPRRCGVALVEKETRLAEVSTMNTTEEGDSVEVIGKIKMTGHPILENIFDHWLKQKEYHTVLRGNQIKKYYQVLKPQISYPDYPHDAVQFGYYFMFKEGDVYAWTEKELIEEDLKIFRRSTTVVSLTYKRYKDLQQAEAQAREAQIEASLERVRSRTMGMQKSEELKEVIQLVYEQFVQLKINVEHTGFILDYKTRDDLHIWLADQREIPSEITIPCFDSPPNNSIREAKEKGQEFFTYLLALEEKNKFYRDLFKLIPGVPEESLEYYFNCPGLAGSGVLLVNVGLYIENFSGTPYTDEENNTLMRFGKVFQQTYTRFLDLKKAEAQAREAQIEASLERVRAAAMAMHKSDELSNVLGVMFDQFDVLGIAPVYGCLDLFDVDNNIFKHRITGKKGYRHMVEQTISLDAMDVWQDSVDEWKKGQPESIQLLHYPKEKLSEFWDTFHILFKSLPQKARFNKRDFSDGIYSVAGYHKHGYIGFMHHREATDEEKSIVVRFATEFDRLYQRFLDLQKAEARAREAQIETALERVRSRTMAMHKSDEIKDVVVTVMDKMNELNIEMNGGISLATFIEGSQDLLHWYVNPAHVEGPVTMHLPYFDNILFHDFVKARKEGKELLPVVYSFEQKNECFEYTFEHSDFKIIPEELKKWIFEQPYFGYSVAIQQHSAIFFNDYTGKLFSEEENEVLLRFAKVFDQAYIRFLDLKKAEAQAKEAIKQASLDRIRGEIASMRTSEDLNRITPIIWRELETLEVPFIRCGVFIVDEENEKVQVYLTTPDGKSLGALNLPFDSNKITSNTVKHWKKNQVYKEHWNKEEFIKWTKSMMEIGQVQNAETYQGSSTLPESLDLHFVPFAQGMLYVGDISALTEEKLDLVRTLADAFSIAYARYEDFKNIEEAKNKIEVTLNELKSAQAQLIHSEKMASLGELTAGIAHEIKNPLNFVNNFSEVSRELLDEMQTELQNKNDEEVIELIEDLKQNLERINQHGKRADSIVKGMLLHSRGTSGEKMLTDINNLLDEYVNLAYHGMRAKDKSFNITMETEYDKSIEKINIVPQDLSRVFLNIINNACYAINDKSKNSGNDFVPTLKVCTKNIPGKVEIRIRDNGNGIPENIRNKLFNPFFTTKPTGEGTGLGLSLSYDIVTKVHGGDIRFESEEGKYTEFIISLPK